MSDGTANHAWCEICTAGPASHEVHESQVFRIPTGTSSRCVDLQINYIDGAREPKIFVGAGEADLTPTQVEILIAGLQEQLRAARAVQTTPVQVA